MITSLLLAAGLIGATSAPAQAAGTGSIEGTVTGEGGTPLEGVFVSLLYCDPNLAPANCWIAYNGVGTTASTDADGEFAITNLDAGQYRVSTRTNPGTEQYISEYYDGALFAEDATSVTVVDGAATTIASTLEIGSSITGTVLGSEGTPIAGGYVWAWLSDHLNGTIAGANIQSDGSYALTGLPDGEYVIQADPGFSGLENYVGEFWENKPDRDSATRFDLVSGDAVVRDFVLDLGGIIEGTVTNGTTPLDGVSVTVYEENTAYGLWNRVDETTTNAAGEYSIEGLDLGDYAVRFSAIDAGGAGYGQQYWSNVPERASATLLTVGPGIVEDGIDAVLTPGGTLSGTITETTGASTVPSASTWVEVFRVDSEGELEGVASKQTDASGDYSFSGLAPGEYTVQATGGSAHDRAYTYYGGAFYAEDADSETVTATAETADVDVDLLQGTTLQGEIRDAVTGGAATGVGFVILYERSPGNWAFPPPHGGQGDDIAYRVTGMPPGNYIVYFTDHRNVPDYYQTQYWQNAPTQSTATIIDASEGGEFLNINAQMTKTPWPALTASATPSPASPSGQAGWYTSPVTVTLAAGGGTEVTDSLRYKINGAASWSAYSTPLSVTADGTTTITYQAQEEEFQNSPEGTLELKLDATAPTTSASVSGRSVTLTASDATSGVASIEYKLNGAAAWTAYSTPVDVGNAAASVVYRATDVAGNVAAEKTQTLGAASGTVTVTTSATPASPDGQNGWYRTSPVTVTGAGSSSLGGTVVIESKVGSGSYAVQASRSVSAQGSTVLTFLGTDGFGNASSEVVRTIKLDTVAPTATATLSGRTVTVTSSDATSGVGTVEYRLGTGAWSAYTAPVPVGSAAVAFSYRVTDAAGNERAGSLAVPAAEETERLAGADRWETSALVSQEAYPEGASVVYVTTGLQFPDALSAGPAAAFEDAPLLLVAPDQIPSSVKAELVRLDPDRIVVIGGTPAVSAAVFTELTTLAGDVERIAGADRYATSVSVNGQVFSDGSDVAYIATGVNFPDALAAGGAAGENDAPVILVYGQAASLDAATTALLEDLGVSSIKVIGGAGAVSAGVFADLDAIADTERLAGANRYETARLINDDAFTSAEQVFLATGLNFPDALAGSAWAAKLGAPLYTVQPNCVTPDVLASITALNPTSITLLGGTASMGAGVKNLTPCS